MNIYAGRTRIQNGVNTEHNTYEATVLPEDGEVKVFFASMDLCGETVDGSEEMMAVDYDNPPVTFTSTGSGVEHRAVMKRRKVNTWLVPNGSPLRQGSSTINNKIWADKPHCNSGIPVVEASEAGGARADALLSRVMTTHGASEKK
jgi:hypothetical protein